MSNLFEELQKEAKKQQEFAEKSKQKPNEPVEKIESEVQHRQAITNKGARLPKHKTYDTTAPANGTTAPKLNVEKLEIIVKELSTISTRRDGLNVRLSDIEALDIDDFINDKLRRKGIKGNHVSASKIMRYAFRYVLRVHEEEFIEALSRALQVKEELTI